METDKQSTTDLKNSSGFNPWLEIWTEPRATISKIVADNPNKSLWLLATIYGFSSLLNSSQTFVIGHRVGFFQICLLAVIFAPIWGYIGFSVWSFFVSITGKLFRGAGSYKAVRAAYSWSCVPLLANMVIWIVLGAYFGRTLFMSAEGGLPMSQSEEIFLFVVMVARLVTIVWSIIIYVNALSEVQKFSIIKGIGNIFLAGLSVAIVSFFFCYLVIALAG